MKAGGNYSGLNDADALGGTRPPDGFPSEINARTRPEAGFHLSIQAFRREDSRLAELPRRSRVLRGFTLIELLLAMAILSMLVTALFTFVFSMGEIWGRGGEKRLFGQHVNAVTRHVESLLRRAAWPRGGMAMNEPFTVREVRTTNGATANLLGFDMLDGDRLMLWPEEALPEVECSLGYERDRGLVLYWRSRLEKHDKNEAPRAVVISPLVSKLTYAYHDANGDSWRKEDNLRRGSSGEWLLPDRLIIEFKEEKLEDQKVEKFEDQRELTLPSGGGGIAF